MAIKEQVKNNNRSTGELASKARARREAVTVDPETTVKEASMDRLGAPAPLPTQIKQPLPDYPFIKSYATIPALRKGGGIQGGAG